MRLNHPDYIKLVTEVYRKKRANNRLSPLLTQSTPANLKKECLNVYRERYDKKDDQTLRAFFGVAEHGRQFLQLIRGFETDKFKPLDNYLKGNTERTEDKNIELLAWLIDFEHRPYLFDNNVLLSDEELSLIRNSGEKQAELEPGKNSLQENEEAIMLLHETEMDGVPGNNKSETTIPLNAVPKINIAAKEKSKRAAIIFLILIICAGGLYTIWQQKHGKQVMGNGNTVCAYWVYDHYEEVPCSEETKGRHILLMNPEKIKSFRKITQQDTITEWSIGKLYYIKDSNIIKCYTEPGNFPEDVNRKLKVLSRRIFEKYLSKNLASEKEVLK